MASAVLASRNEQYWGERKVYMRKYPNNLTNNTPINSRFDLNPNPSSYRKPAQNLTPNSDFIRQSHDHIPKTHLRQKNEPPLMPPPPPPPLAVNCSQLFNPNHDVPALQKDQFHRGYVTFNLASYSGRELKQLKRQLVSDLVRVRGLLTRIENQPLESRPGFHNLQFRPPSTEAGHHALAPPSENRTPKGSQPKRASGFVARKGKKNKISGQKRAYPFASGQDKKRAVVEKVAGAMMRQCNQILTKLMRHHYSWVFNKPVEVELLGLHDYYQIIKHPMDLGTVKSRLNKKEYQTPLDFASDVRLTFENAMKYNPKGQDVHAMAEMLFRSFDEMFQPEYQKYKAKHLKAIAEEQVNHNSWAQTEPLNMMSRALPEQTPRVEESELISEHTQMVPPPVQGAPVPRPSLVQGEMDMPLSRSGKLPKPKAKDHNKRSMNDEEKSKLGLHLQNVPQDNMEQVVQIVRKRNPLLLPEDDEIELDIEALDSETLWELDRFVSYHKKAVNKMRRQEIENAALTKLVTEPLPSELPPQVAVQSNKKGDAGDEDVDIGEEIPANNFPHVEIEKDPAGASSGSSSSGSSGSSSDDCSSSSDSDSGSSSGSDSDEDSVQSPFVEPGRASAA